MTEMWEREQEIWKRSNNKGFRGEWLLLAERGRRVKCLQLWLCGVMSLVMSHASVSLSLAATGGQKQCFANTSLYLFVALSNSSATEIWSQLTGFSCTFCRSWTAVRQDRIISVRPCLYSVPSLELLFFSMTHSVSQFPCLVSCFCLLMFLLFCTIWEGLVGCPSNILEK